MGKLAGKVAIVTGGGRRIGRAIAQAQLQEDATVVVTAARQKTEQASSNAISRLQALLTV
ncbi:MAG: SDR family NAD(P)-dependent oxidoreductase [Actinomycetota bacterium]|nr:SDR family NAD(P)-dependent oxidoreductase [Actinomycetota bacterium]